MEYKKRRVKTMRSWDPDASALHYWRGNNCYKRISYFRYAIVLHFIVFLLLFFTIVSLSIIFTIVFCIWMFLLFFTVYCLPLEWIVPHQTYSTLSGWLHCACLIKKKNTIKKRTHFLRVWISMKDFEEEHEQQGVKILMLWFFILNE
jgi:hypothetical protein